MSALLYASVTGAVLIAVIGLLRLLFRRQVSRSVFLILWLLAVVRLLLPIWLPAPTSIYNLPLFSQKTGISAPVTVESPPIIETPAANQIILPDTQSDTVPQLPPVEEEAPITLTQLLTGLWAAVGLCLFLGIELRHLLNRRRYRFSLPLPEGIRVPQGLRVRMLEGLSSPLTYGLFRPTVLLPARSLEQPEQLQHILLHEQAHIRCGDMFKKHLFLLTACIHWFNPLVWLMIALAFEDMEVRCDAMAVGKLGEQHKKDYAQTLVNAETARLTDLLQNGFSHSTMARRLTALIHLRRRPVLSTVVCLCLVLALTLCFMTGPMTLSAQAEGLPDPETAPMTEPTELTRTEPLVLPETAPPPVPEDLPGGETQSPTVDSAEDYTPLLLPDGRKQEESTRQTEPPAETQSYSNSSSQSDIDTIHDLVNAQETKVQINFYPAATIHVGSSTKAALYVSYDGVFYTDRPDVVTVEAHTYSPYPLTDPSYMWANFGFFLKASVTITGNSPGTATVYFRCNDITFTLFTVTVEERDVLVIGSGAEELPLPEVTDPNGG